MFLETVCSAAPLTKLPCGLGVHLQSSLSPRQGVLIAFPSQLPPSGPTAALTHPAAHLGQEIWELKSAVPMSIAQAAAASPLSLSLGVYRIAVAS